MSAYLRRYHERGQRCDRVNDSRVEDFPANSKWATLAASVKGRVANVATLNVDKANSMGKRQHGTAGREKTRKALSDLVETVAKTAEAATPEHPDIKGMFERPGKDHSDETLIATARSFADRAAPFVPLFVDYALPPTFVNDLRSLADTLDNYIAMQNEGVGTRIHANASVREEMRLLNEELGRMNVIYHNKYRDNPSVLAEWQSAYHLEAARGSRRRTQINGDGTPPPDGANP